MQQKMNLDLVIYPNTVLRQNAIPYTDEQIQSNLVRQTAGAMIRRMYEYSGIGLAAQQVGIPNAIFIMDTTWVGGRKRPQIFINPEIVGTGDEVVSLEHPGEGCLSLPFGYRNPIKRYSRVQLKWKDLQCNEHTKWFENVEAICIQHEMDHLNGILFVDRLTRLRQDMFIRRYNKVIRHYRKGQKKLQRAVQVKQKEMKRYEAAADRRDKREFERDMRRAKKEGWVGGIQD